MTALPVPGDRAPGFELSNQHGEPVSLYSLRGTAVVLIFYPFAFSRVCTGELDEIHRNLEEFRTRGVKILAVSVDHKYALRTYAEEHGYSFDLLADFWPHGAVAEKYGALDRADGYARRITFFIDAAGFIRARIESPLGQPRPFEDYRAALVQLCEPTVAASQ